jgi:acyl-CoA dehydrogenase
MAWDFATEPEFQEKLDWMRTFVREEIIPLETLADVWRTPEGRRRFLEITAPLKEEVKRQGLWAAHLPPDMGGLGFGQVKLGLMHEILGQCGYAPSIFGNNAPDSGNAELLAVGGTPAQREQWMQPLLDGKLRSCFSMTEPGAGADPTLLSTTATRDGDEWVINGHKWFISGARGAKFALLVARTEDDPDLPQAANSCFIVDLPSEGWNIVRDVHTMSGGHNHCEILIEDLRVPAANMLGGRGQGHLLGQYRLGPARLAHCMRWIGQAEIALDMMVKRSLERYSHGSYLAEKQGIQWMIADSAMELYQCKLMVLHAAYKVEHGMDFVAEVSMAKHFVANSLWKIIDRAIQVHGALGYSTDTPLANMMQQARWSRFADGADEIHQMRIAQRTIASYKDFGSTKKATGDLPL